MELSSIHDSSAIVIEPENNNQCAADMYRMHLCPGSGFIPASRCLGGFIIWCLKRIDAHRQCKTHVISHVQGLHMGLKTPSTCVHRVRIDNHEETSPNMIIKSECNKEMAAYRGISI